MKIFIQSNSERTLPHHFDAACALYGAQDMGWDYRLTSFEEVASGKFDNLVKEHTFVGSTEFMMEVFKRAGKTNVGVPENSNRECEIIDLSEARERALKGEKLFIKPLQIKLFTGFVLDGMQYTCLNGLPDDTKVMAYEPFKYKIESEWRIYIKENKMIDARHYSGDFTIVPKFENLQSTIEYNQKSNGFPYAYTIDVGVLQNGENVIIEYNDMWAIGNYGLPNDLYVQLLRRRYFEIVKSKEYAID